MENKDVPERIKKKFGSLTSFNEDNDPGTLMRHNYKPDCIHHGIRSVNLTGDGRYLIITYEGRRGYIRAIDLEKLELLPHTYPGHKDSVRMVSVSRNNKYFFSASWDGTFRKNELLTGRCLQVLGMTGRSPSCFLDPGDRYLFTASYDYDIAFGANNTGRMWDLETNEIVAFYRHSKSHRDPLCIDIASDGKYAYSGSDDGVGICWDIISGVRRLTYFECDANVRKIAVSDHFFIACSTDGMIRIHDKTSGKLIRHLFHSKSEAMDVKVSRDESRLWSASMDGTVKCFDLPSGNVRYHKKIHEHWIWCICLTRSDSVLVSGSSDGTIVFLNTADGRLLARLHCFPQENEFLFECPRDIAFPHGLFFTTNRNFIEVTDMNRETGRMEIMDLSDPRRISYIDRLNLKNVVITRLSNYRQYNAITEKYINGTKILNRVDFPKLPGKLKS